jgi:hypothetical protein
MMEEKAKQLLQKYLNGEASAAEIKQVEDWYAQLDNASKNSAGTQSNTARTIIGQYPVRYFEKGK